MNETCLLLRKSFYEDEWELRSGVADIWVRKKDGLALWGSNTVFDFNGYRNNIHIPWYLRPYMRGQLRIGQNALATKKYLTATT